MLSIDQILSGSSSLRGRGDLLVEVVVVLGEGAVNVEPPVADEVLLVEDCSEEIYPLIHRNTIYIQLTLVKMLGTFSYIYKNIQVYMILVLMPYRWMVLLSLLLATVEIDSPIWTQEAVLEEAANPVLGADMERLTVGLRVSVVALDLAVAGEGGVRRDAVHGVILPRLPRYRLCQSKELLGETSFSRSSVQGESLLAREGGRQGDDQSCQDIINLSLM